MEGEGLGRKWEGSSKLSCSGDTGSNWCVGLGY